MDSKTKFSADLELEATFKELPPSDFLYDRKGPWPQPSPNHPFGEAPGVVHIPFVEWVWWWMMIGSRYVFVWIFLWPLAFLKALLWWRITPATDLEFEDYFFNSCYAKFLNPDISERLRILFSDYMKEDKKYYVCDFIAMKVLKPIAGNHCEPCTVLFEKTEKSIKVVSINLKDYCVDETDGDLWSLAKMIALQAAGNHIVLATHPRLHFPMDAINAITKTAVPRDHILFQLIYPHTEFTLKLDEQVLNSPLSVLVNKPWMLYAPFPADAESIRDLVVVGFYGIKGNSSYPKYEYPLMGPSKVYSDYGTFHAEYYKVYFKFVKKVVAEIPNEDMFVSRWADYIKQQLPTFPGADEIWKGDTLTHAIASYLWDVSLGHGADHKTYGEIPLNKNPLRMRVASPEYKNPNFSLNLNEVVTILDQTRLVLGNSMFFKPTNVSKTVDAFYGFNLPVLKDAVKEFREDLYKVEDNLKVKNFMPVDEIPASIQY